MGPAGSTEFLVLGPLDVRIDGESIPLGGAKQRAVLALLLLRSDQVVPLEQIVDGVWGERPPAAAAHTVEGYVSRLRRLIDSHGPSLVHRGGGYRLDLAGAHFDAHDARDLLESAAEAAGADEHERAASLAGEALRLWRGPALPDAPLHGAARIEAEELGELRLQLVELLADAELALGRHGAATALLRPVVDEHPYRERFVAQLMLALYRAGRPAEALEAYERCRRALDRDLGLRPSSDLQRLSGEIVRHDPRLALPVPHEAEKATAAPRRRRTRRAAAAALVVLATAAVAAAFVFTRDGGAPPRLLPSSVVRLDPETLQPTKVIPVGPRADFVVAAGRYLWVTHGILRHTDDGELRNAGDRTLTRVDPETGATRPVGQLAPCGTTPDPSGDVWVANCYESGAANVVRVHASSLEFRPTCFAPTASGRRRADAGRGFYRGMAYGGGSLWLTDTDETRRVVTELDPRTCGRQSISFDRPVKVLTWADGYDELWMDDFIGGSVSRMDAGTRTVTKTYASVAHNPGVLVAERDAVWVGDWDIADVVRLPAVGPGRPRHVSLPVRRRPAGVTGIAAGAGTVWATVPEDRSLWRIDATTGRPERIPLRYSPWGVTVADDGVWVTLRPRG